MLKRKNFLIKACLILIIISFFVFILMKINKKNNNDNDNDINFFNTKIINGELINMLIQPNSDWSQLPLTKRFKQKFNNKYGVLGDIKADKIELDPYERGTFPFDQYSYILVTKGLKQTAYIYHLEQSDTMWDDFWLTQTYEITDENGNQLEMVSKIDKKTFGVSFRKLAWGYEDEKSVGVSDNFKKKYNCFLDLFIHYSPLEFNQITFLEEKSSYDNKEAYFEVDSVLECKKRKYIVKFKLDKNNFLDYVDVKLLEENKYKNESPDGGVALFYVNSDWENRKISKKFLSKFKQNIGVFPDISLLGNNFSFENQNEYKQIKLEEGRGDINQIRAFNINGNFVYYLYQVYYDEIKFVDDIVYEKLPYENMPIEEVKKLYLNSIQ